MGIRRFHAISLGDADFVLPYPDSQTTFGIIENARAHLEFHGGSSRYRVEFRDLLGWCWTQDSVEIPVPHLYRSFSFVRSILIVQYELEER